MIDGIISEYDNNSVLKKYVRPALRFLNTKCLPLVSFPETKSLNLSFPQESDLMCANQEFFAFALNLPGGRIGITKAFNDSSASYINITRGQKLHTTHMKTIVNGSDLNDFSLSPFRTPVDDESSSLATFGAQALVTVCDDGNCRLWHIPIGPDNWKAPEITSSTARRSVANEINTQSHDLVEPILTWRAHNFRATIVKWHPTLPGVVATASPNNGSSQLFVWQLNSNAMEEPKLMCKYECFSEAVCSVAFSFDGARLVAAAKDGSLYIFQFDASSELKSNPIFKLQSDIARNCRVFWIGRAGIPGTKEFIYDNPQESTMVTERFGITGLGKGNDRKVCIYNVLYEPNTECAVVKDVQKTFSLDLEKSPSAQRPIFDPDTYLLYLLGRGESAITVCDCHPLTGQLSLIGRFGSQSSNSAVGQSFVLLPKTQLNVAKVEIALAVKLNLNNSLETVSFTVPRAKPQYFQDDLFPDTVDAAEPPLQFETLKQFQAAVSARVNSNLDFMQFEPKTRISLKPLELCPLSQIPAEDLLAQSTAQNAKKTHRASVHAPSNNADDLKAQMVTNLNQMTNKSHSRRVSTLSTASEGLEQLQEKLATITATEADTQYEQDELEKEIKRRALIGQQESEVKDEEWD